MEYIVYEYTEGHGDILPGISYGRDVVGYDDDGEIVLRAGFKKNRFLENQTGGNIDARLSLPDNDAVFFGNDEPKSRKNKIRVIAEKERENIIAHKKMRDDKAEKHIAHVAKKIDGMVAAGIIDDADIDEELSGYDEEMKNKIKNKRNKKSE